MGRQTAVLTRHIGNFLVNAIDMLDHLIIEDVDPAVKALDASFKGLQVIFELETALLMQGQSLKFSQ